MSRHQHFFQVMIWPWFDVFLGTFKKLFADSSAWIDGFWTLEWSTTCDRCVKGVSINMCIARKNPVKMAQRPPRFFWKWGLNCCWLTPHLWEYDGQTYSLHQAVRLGKPTHRMQFLLHFKRFFIHYFDKCVHIFQSFAFIFGGLKCTETFFSDLCPTCITLTQSEFQKWLDGVYETQFRF